MRLVYNRIGKAGSTTMWSILAILVKRNHFNLKVPMSENNPSKDRLSQMLGQLKDNTVWIDHANFLKGNPSHGAATNLTWINVVREPIERWKSMYYYEVSVAVRGSKAALAEKMRAKDRQCGCAKLEFHECIELRYKHNCSMGLPSQISYFCETQERCTPELAMTRVNSSYLFVGLTEELTTTVALLEQMLPHFFRGALETSKRVGHALVTPARNPLTGTHMEKAPLTNQTRWLIAAGRGGANYAHEVEFYHYVSQLFWRRACDPRWRKPAWSARCALQRA